MKRDPASVEKWGRWLEVLGNEVFTLHLWRTTWRGMISAAEGNPSVPRTHVFNYLAMTYSTSQAVAIRRLCGEQTGEVSFRNLLGEIVANPELLPDREVDVDAVQADLKSLDSGNLRLVRKYVSQYLAHRQEIPVARVPTFEDLHAAIDDLGRLLQKYKLLVEGVHQMLDPVTSADWMAPFRVAWLPPVTAAFRVGPEHHAPSADDC